MGARELYLLFVYLSFIAVGVTTPFVFSLGYVWIDIFYPQAMSNLLSSFPIAMIMGLGAILFYLAADRKYPAISLHTVLVVCMAIWISLTMLWAEAPAFAAVKYDWASKTVLFSAFLPFVFRSRVQIESFLLVVVLAIVGYMLPVALKSLISGGGYGQAIGLVNNNAGLNESSALATICVAIIPILMYFKAHSLLLPKSRIRDATLLVVSFLSVFGAMGTFARTAVISFTVLGVDMFIRTRRKFLFLIVAAVVGAAAAYNASSGWDSRMKTIESFDQEESAYTRVLVWQWTMGYVLKNPLGGGFNDYVISRIEYPPDDGHPQGTVVVGRAFHSSYFEVLGEHGFPGLFLFLALMMTSLLSMQKVRRQTKHRAHMVWAYDLAGALRTAFLVCMGGGAFVGIAFQPPYWYLFAIMAALRHHVKIAISQEAGIPGRAKGRTFGIAAASRPLTPVGAPAGRFAR